jgi:hypothetical protein
MKCIRMPLAVVGLIIASGAIDAVRADNNSATLYTAAVRAAKFACDAVNVSHKALHITTSIIDLNGNPLSVSPRTVTAPGTEFSHNFGDPAGDPTDAYCKFQVFGTDDSSDVRVVLSTVLIRTFDQGAYTKIPVFVTKTVEGY